MAIRLIVIRGYDRDKFLELNDVRSYCIGRGGTGRTVDFKVDPCEYLTSRQHFYVDFDPPHIFIRDNNSTNGTLIQRGNDTIPVTGEQTELVEGDLIVAGNTVFRLETVLEDNEMPFETESPSPVSINSPAGKPVSDFPVEKPVSDSPAEKFLSDSPAGKPVSDSPAKQPLSASSGEKPLPAFLGEKPLSSAPAKKPVISSPVSPDAASAAPEQPKPAAVRDYYSVVVPEIQLFHSSQVRCIACGELITVEISPSELQAYGYPVFMCGGCSSGFSNVHNLKDLGSYGILQELREDGMGLVYLARHKETGLLAEIRVIVPRLFGEDIQYLKREISVIQTVSHPNLVRLYEYAVYRDRVYLIYEYMPEGNLNDYLETVSGGRLSRNDACGVVCDVLSGLRQCHEMGIVHGDIRPESILFKRDPRGKTTARLGDVGLALLCDNMGLSGFSSGHRETQAFKAPEVIDNYRMLKPAADIYSMGMVLYFLLSGSLPCSNSTEAAGCSSAFSFDAKAIPLPERNPDIPYILSHILEKATCREPEGRYQNAAEMLQAILEMRF